MLYIPSRNGLVRLRQPTAMWIFSAREQERLRLNTALLWLWHRLQHTVAFGSGAHMYVNYGYAINLICQFCVFSYFAVLKMFDDVLKLLMSTHIHTLIVISVRLRRRMIHIPLDRVWQHRFTHETPRLSVFKIQSKFSVRLLISSSAENFTHELWQDTQPSYPSVHQDKQQQKLIHWWC